MLHALRPLYYAGQRLHPRCRFQFSELSAVRFVYRYLRECRFLFSDLSAVRFVYRYPKHYTPNTKALNIKYETFSDLSAVRFVYRYPKHYTPNTRALNIKYETLPQRCAFCVPVP
jgi:transcriptional accessory protein Tex/SPT6